MASEISMRLGTLVLQALWRPGVEGDLGAVGAFMLTFGFLFLSVSSSIVYELLGNLRDPSGPILELEVVSLVITSVGAGLLAYGVLSRDSPPLPQE